HDGPVNVVWGQTLDGKGYTIRKLRYEAVPGLWVGALLYEPKDLKGRRPGVLNPNGHVGEPGMTIDYKQERCINLVKRGMIALSTEFIGQGQLRGPGYVHNDAAHLDLCGRAGVSVFYLALQRALDVLCDHPAVDLDRVAVTGLSGGGWQTIMIGALDIRVRLAAPNAGYINFEERVWNHEDAGDLEQNPDDLVAVADYDALTAMLYPRPALLIYNEKDDCCFRAARAIQAVYRPARSLYEVMGIGDWFGYHVNSDPGTHNYLKDNREAFYRFINRHFLPESERLDAEIPVADEIRTAAELAIDYPEGNADFHTLAVGAGRSLPRDPRPTDSAVPAAWRTRTRQALATVVRPDPTMSAGDPVRLPCAFEEVADTRGRASRLCLGGQWTVPIVEYAESDRPVEGTTLVLADEGLEGAKPLIADAIRQRRRAVAVDLLLMGECQPNVGWQPRRNGQAAMMISAAGRRPLGIQVAQLAAVIERLRKDRPDESIEVAARGRMAGLAAVVTAALKPGCCNGVRVVGLEPSLKDLARVPVGYDIAPSLFCFGLLEVADIPELIALAEPTAIRLEK
ncbi:MAG TPA: acetylxylan esterase, partial [Phycisphaerae bacterium]|nr:acetylxylan esterase [Phycisphaerae bacterium]